MNDRKLLRTVIARTFSHVSADDIQTLAKLENDCRYACMQLGNSAQLSAHNALHSHIDSVLETMPEHYVREFASRIKDQISE